MIRLEMKNYKMILTEKHYHLEKFINMDILMVKKYNIPIKEK